MRCYLLSQTKNWTQKLDSEAGIRFRIFTWENGRYVSNLSSQAIESEGARQKLKNTRNKLAPILGNCCNGC